MSHADILERALQASLAADLDALAELVTDDDRVWTATATATSRDELVAALGDSDEAFDELVLDTAALDVAGDFACVEWTMTMTHAGAITLGERTVGPTGLQVTVHGVAIAEFDGERICAVRQYSDELAVLEQLRVAAADA